MMLLGHIAACCSAACAARAYAVKHLTLRLLLDEVVLYAADVLLSSNLAISEGVADGEGHAVDGYFDVGVRGEVLAAAIALDVQVATLVETHDTLYAQGELVVEQ